ncbi:hypothetical protein H483_0101505 [Dietzia sp. UCD-THP]|uniref:type VII secretion integral membrane protein EccD n=1 Tax=Dietzia sp. UCD-THP TaxID=1292020 RepID=UPI000378E005|nr:type VII secretion integral membrane protein EccD [Dietzia sp. UCD-THP]EYT65476.1 hypothetical protein H483_0101505 [Dietzia sp. UCD-THP]
MTEQNELRAVASGVEPLDQRRVSIVCRTTRVDLSLPAHLELVAVIPEIVDLVRDRIRAAAGPASHVDVDSEMGGCANGSWQLSRLAGGPLAISETLAQQRVHDGEILVLDHRPVPTPAPLFDDVLQGLTDPDVARSRIWGRRDAVATATSTVAVAALAAATALVTQWWHTGGVLTPLVAALLAAVGLATVLALRRFDVPGSAHAVAAAATIGFTVIAAGTIGAAPVGAGSVVGGLTAGAVVAGVLRCTIFRPAPGRSYGLAAGYLALALLTSVGAISAMVTAYTTVPVHAVGAGVVLVGLLILTAAPGVSVAAARIPIPPVPAPGEDIEVGDLGHVGRDVDAGHPDDLRRHGPLPTPATLRHRFLTSRSWLTGLLSAGGTACTAGALIALTGTGASPGWSAPLALVVIVMLILRGLGYSDRVHTSVLLGSALALAGGVLIGAAFTHTSPITVVVPAAAALAAAVAITVAALPQVELSPAALRAVGTIEVIVICVMVPLAVGAMDVFSTVRQR